MRFTNSALNLSFRASLIAAMLSLGIVASYSQDSPPPNVQQQRRGNDETKQPNQETTQGKPQPVVIQGNVEVISQPSAAEIERQRQEKPQSIWVDPSWIGAIAAGVAAFFALLAWLAAVRQMRLSVESMQLDNRAWVMISKAVFGFKKDQDASTVLVELGQQLPIHVTMGNSGKTPALDVRIASACFFLPEVTDEAIEESAFNPDPSGGGTIVIGPSVDFVTEFKTNRALTEEDMNGTGKDRFVVAHGVIEYADIFKNKHTTKFRLQGDLREIARGVIALVGSRNGNTAD